MTAGRLAPEPALAARRSRLVARLGKAWAAALAEARRAGGADPLHPAAVIPAPVVADLVAALRLDDPEDALLLALDGAAALADPPISGYRVGAVGLASASGDLVLGGNLEVPGAAIWHTVHAEGFVTLLARARGEPLATIALRQARPCAHCRQLLAEIDGALGAPGDEGGLRLIDLDGLAIGLHEVYPMAFAPGDLGMPGCRPGREAWPDLGLVDAALPADAVEALLRAGRQAHAPYSRSPAAVVLRLADGGLVAGSGLESVAFNPSVGPLQDALVGVVGAGHRPGDVAAAWLAVHREAAVGHEAACRDALAAIAPGAPLHVTYWS
jgi:cytidine deaminase